MIVSASYRTDIPAFFGPWFRARLAAGSVQVKNPYGGPVRTVSLAPADVDAFVFWTRNVGPFFPALADLAARGTPFVVQFTVTGYPRAIETSTVAPETALAQIRTLAQTYGARGVVWRYDPVLSTSLTPPDWHAANFMRLAAALCGSVDEVVLSFAQIYAKTKRNLNAAAAEHGFAWDDPAPEAKAELLARLAQIAAEHGLRASLCGQSELMTADLTAADLPEARCIDLARLSDVAGRSITAPAKPHRKCACAAAVDIGGYDTCPHGCTYCYAVRNRAAAKRNFAAHRETDATL